ncbi:MAG: lipocalin family protein [Cryomorphaceae bacterium]
MKKYFLIPLMAVAMIIVGCSDDDDSNGGNGSSGGASPATYTGTWELVSVTYFVDFGEVGSFSETLSADSCMPKPVTVFNADSTVTTVNFDIDSNENCDVLETLEGTYESLENGNYLLSLEENGQIEQEEVELELSDENNTLRIVFEDVDGEYRTRWTRQ